MACSCARARLAIALTSFVIFVDSAPHLPVYVSKRPDLRGCRTGDETQSRRRYRHVLDNIHLSLLVTFPGVTADTIDLDTFGRRRGSQRFDGVHWVRFSSHVSRKCSALPLRNAGWCDC
jgi:hypothetical protein